jgi:D-aspartate ligase
MDATSISTASTVSSDRSGARPHAIVIGANENGLSVARSLAELGVRTYSLGGVDWLARSRHVDVIEYQQPTNCTTDEQLQIWLDWLLGPEAEPFHGSVLIPCNDLSVEMIAVNREALARHFLLDESRDDITLTLLDKIATYEMAGRIGVEAPRTWEIPDRRAFLDALPELRYPCAIKPRSSVAFWNRFKTKLIVANDAAEMREAHALVEESGLDVLITEVIPGADDQYFSYWTYVADDGEPQFHFTKRKYRQYPIHHGLGTLHRSYEDAELRALGERFVRGSGLRGIAVVEFKRDARDGRLKLMECNVRFTKSNDVIVRSGIDMPKLFYGRITGAPYPPVDDFEAGVGLWWPREDRWAFRQYRAEGELTRGQWLASLRGRTYVPVFSLTDPGPSLSILLGRIASRLRLVRGQD